MRKFFPFVFMAILALVAVQVMAGPVVTGDLLELIGPERAAYLRDSVCTQVSSYDRTGDNDDGFNGTYSFLRKEGENLVIFDSEGPGCIYRVWSADPLDGWMKFYFDGEETPRLELKSFRDLFNGNVYPFVHPLSQRFIGGWCSYVPIPFEKSLKIVSGGPVHFLQITWQKFSSAEGVKTFSSEYTREDRLKLAQVKHVWRNLGQPPVAFPVAAEETKGEVTVGGGSDLELVKLAGSGLIRGFRIKAESADTKIGRKALLLMHVDGQKQPNIYSPLGDFFLDPYAVGNSKSLMIGKHDNTYYSYWVMPYASGASIKIRNESPLPLKLSYEVVYEPVKKLPEGMGRFFAWWHRQNPTIEGQNFPILEATGRGHWLGCSHAMQNEHLGVGFLEGDEMLWIDDRDNTYFNGTGTEDYFNGGWYFGTTGSAPYYGCGVFKEAGQCHAYRIHLTDLVPFQQQAKIGIEHGPRNNWPSDYAGVTYWYAEPGTKHSFTPTELEGRMNRPDRIRGVIEAETLLDPKSGGQIVDDINVSYYLSSAKGVSTASAKEGESFTLLVDAAETRNYYLDIGFVKGPDRGIAQVLVDDQPLGREVDLYAEQLQNATVTRFGMTQELTVGKHAITVKSTGKNNASQGASVLADYIILRPDLFYEGEHLEVASEKGGTHAIRSHGPETSNMQMLWFTGDGPGSSMTLRVPVLKTGKQEILVKMFRNRAGAVVKFKVNGNPAGEEMDGFQEWSRYETVSLGQMDLQAGDHEITFEITGKHDWAEGHTVVVDCVTVR